LVVVTIGRVEFAARGFAASAVQSGTLKGGLQGAFSAAIFFGIGSYFDQANSASSWARTGDKLNSIGRVSKIVAHGAAGGIMSDLQGGKFAHGFASAGFSEAAGPLTEGIQSDFLRGAAHALIGGSASSLSGGKFANGAVTGAMSFAFGSMARRKDDEGLGYNARKKSAGNVEYRTDMPEEFAELLRKHPEINAKMDSAMEASDQWGPNREHGFYGYTPDSGEGTAVFVDMPEAQFRWRSLSYGFIPYVPPPSIDGYTLQVVYHSHPFDVCFARCYPGQTLIGPREALNNATN
jgi:hypothetical protein